jgi:hypothetical protein
MYPISSTLLMDGELAGDQNHQLQLVIRVDEFGAERLYARLSSSN